MLEFNVLSSDTNKKVHSTLIINNFAYTKPLMNILIDTGAYIPTWTKGFNLFMKTFPNATFAKAECLSKGFGLSYDVLPVYVIKEYRLTDVYGHTLCIMNLPIAITKKDFSFNMLLGLPTFINMNFSYKSSVYKEKDNKKSVNILSNPKFYLYPRKIKYNAIPVVEEVTDELLSLLEPEYPNIRNRLKQQKIMRNISVLAQK